MTTTEILSKFDIAVQTLFSNDRYLLQNNLNERSITYKLAEYLQPLFNGYNVDIEYNGDAENPKLRKALAIENKRLNEIKIDPNEDAVYRLSPDIIIHHRGDNDNNLLMIEVKKDISPKKFQEFDLIKLEHMTIDYLDNHYNYHLGIALILNTGDGTGAKAETYFQNGIPTKNRQELL